MEKQTNKNFQSPRGTHDLLPSGVNEWRFVEETFRKICACYNYGEIRTPMFESTELFTRSAGDSSDVMVTKQMYTFTALDEQSYTLRAEGTAPAVRSYLQHNLNQLGATTKLFYVAPIFRYEAPQSGRMRQHHQCGVELLGAATPEADAEVLALAHDFLQALEVDAVLHLNSLGTPESRAGYITALRTHLEPQLSELSEDSKKRFAINPLRIFDSKETADRMALEGAPRLLDYLALHDAESVAHFRMLCAHLDALDITYEIDHNLVRGFDYYSRTAFEFVSDKLGAQSTVLGGGRYDGLVEQLGGQPTPGIGFGSGIERLLLVREACGISAPPPLPLAAYLVAMGDDARASGVKIVKQLRDAGIACDADVAGRGARAQMREANRQAARFMLILGEEEVANGTVAVKNMSDASQQTVPVAELVAHLQTALN